MWRNITEQEQNAIRNLEQSSPLTHITYRVLLHSTFWVLTGREGRGGEGLQFCGSIDTRFSVQLRRPLLNGYPKVTRYQTTRHHIVFKRLET
jgi:hypothetical protein